MWNDYEQKLSYLPRTFQETIIIKKEKRKIGKY